MDEKQLKLHPIFMSLLSDEKKTPNKFTILHLVTCHVVMTTKWRKKIVRKKILAQTQDDEMENGKCFPLWKWKICIKE